MAKLPIPFPQMTLPFLILLLISLPFQVSSRIPTLEERTILLKLKQQLGNPPSLQSWNSTSSPCDWPEITCTGNSVSEILLRDKNITQRIPATICDLKNLTILDLSWNYIPGEFPKELYDCAKLQVLDLSQNYFTGPIPGNIDRISGLQFIDLGANNFSGDIPRAIGRLSELETLNLYQNEFNGTFPVEIGDLSNLQVLALAYNNKFVPAKIPVEFGKLKKLKTMWITEANLIGEIPDSIGNLSSLEILDLSRNYLEGDIPSSVFTLKNLTQLFVYQNRLSGSIPEEFDKIPDSFDNLLNLEVLDLAENYLEGDIPSWVFTLKNLTTINLFQNRLSGKLRPSLLENLQYLDLSSNLLQGPLPAPPQQVDNKLMQFFSVSHNNMTGTIPSSFCNLRSIKSLLLSNNNFHGVIPQCLGNTTNILVLDLKTNNFHGSIPQTFANGSKLTTLNLNDNLLEGPLPPSLVNCGNLTVLDVGNNMINDTFPHWLATLQNLQVLILRSNKYYGPLDNPRTRVPFSELRILDVSHNGFTGSLRKEFFEDFQGMMTRKNESVAVKYMGDSYYKDYVLLMIKGVERELKKILTIFTALDLSSNKFQGDIPDVVGKLNGLLILNFSHNSLIGHIPLSLKNLANIESLDLSSNKLDGQIPMQLKSLTFLSVLNLSYNLLGGPIPQGNQFDTFRNDCYIGNLGLCGFPLSKSCSNIGEVLEPADPKSTILPEESWFDWKISLMGYGCGLVIGLSIGYIVFRTGKPEWFVNMTERKQFRKVRKPTGRRTRRRN